AKDSDDTANSSNSNKVRGSAGGQEVQSHLSEWRAKPARKGVANAGGSGSGRSVANKVTVASTRRTEPASGAGAGAGRSDVGKVAGTRIGTTVDVPATPPSGHARMRSAADSRSCAGSSRSSMLGFSNNTRTEGVSSRHGGGPETASDRRGALASSSREGNERGESVDNGAPKGDASGGDSVFAATLAAGAASSSGTSSRESGRSSSTSAGGRSNRRERGEFRNRGGGRHHDREKSQEESRRGQESREHGDADGESVGDNFERSQHEEHRHGRESSRGASSRPNVRGRLEVTPYRRRGIPYGQSPEVSLERSSQDDSYRKRSRSTDHRRRGSDSSREGHTVPSESTGRRGRRSGSEASSGTGNDSQSRGHSHDSFASTNSSGITKQSSDSSFVRRSDEPACRD
ncbi:unnamed protein product, partial [Sphacelaria rigidula]